MTILHLVRHGETVWHAENRYAGVSDVALPRLLSGDQRAWDLLWISRVPRTLAVVLAGSAVAVAGLILQLMARNRFVEPSTVGTVESATLGILVVTVLTPGAPLLINPPGGCGVNGATA